MEIERLGFFYHENKQNVNQNINLLISFDKFKCCKFIKKNKKKCCRRDLN